MRLYAVADIHGRPERLARMQRSLERHRPRALILAGDILGLRRRRTTLDALRRLPLPVLAVAGNAESLPFGGGRQALRGIDCLHLSSRWIEGVRVTGISGTVLLPLRSRVAWRERAVLAAARGLVDSATVLVTHPPPLGTLDEVAGRFHAGSRAVAQLVRRRRPAVVCCGHIHERPGIRWLGRTLVVNCSMARTGTGALIDLRPGKPPQAAMLDGQNDHALMEWS